MRRLVLSTLLLGTAPLLAQSNSSQAVLTSPPHSVGCPVDLSGRYSSVGAVAQVGKGPAHSSLGYTVTFTPLNTHSIVQAKLTLHGLNGAQIMPTKNLSTSNATEDLTVAPSATDTHSFESIVYAQKLTGVQWMELDDIKYADGTHWQKSANSVCLVVPSLLRLINVERATR